MIGVPMVQRDLHHWDQSHSIDFHGIVDTYFFLFHLFKTSVFTTLTIARDKANLTRVGTSLIGLSLTVPYKCPSKTASSPKEVCTRIRREQVEFRKRVAGPRMANKKPASAGSSSPTDGHRCRPRVCLTPCQNKGDGTLCPKPCLLKQSLCPHCFLSKTTSFTN